MSAKIYTTFQFIMTFIFCREQLAAFLSANYESEVREDHLILTPGASLGLWMAGMKLLPAGKGVVFMECPSYFIASQMLAKDLGNRLFHNF